MSLQKICEYLDWDSAFFGLRVARLNSSNLSADSLKQAMDWCREQKIDCLYCLVNCVDTDVIHLVQRQFLLVGIKVEMLLRLPQDRFSQVSTHAIIRYAHESDIGALREIAKRCYYDSRFYTDKKFSRSKCDELYAYWIEQSCRRNNERVLVAEQDGHVIGYVACVFNSPIEGQISLIGVDEHARGKRVGTQLIDAAVALFQTSDMRAVRVVTQGSNIQAQRLYHSAGFQTHTISLWFHKWFDHNIP